MPETTFHTTFSTTHFLLSRAKNGSESGLRSAVSYRFGFNGKENDNEVKGTGNSVDFGARIYDSRLGRWLSLDPLQEKYPNFSPFSFCAGNPIIFVDPDGRYIKGLDGKPVTYSINDDGSVTWSSNASSDVKFLGNILLSVPTGKESLDMMINMPTKIKLKALDRNNKYAFAFTKHSKRLDNEGYAKSGKIKIFLGAIEEGVATGDYMDMTEGVIANASHEPWHLDPQDIKWFKDLDAAGNIYLENYCLYEKYTLIKEFQARSEYWEKMGMASVNADMSYYINSTIINKTTFDTKFTPTYIREKRKEQVDVEKKINETIMKSKIK